MLPFLVHRGPFAVVPSVSLSNSWRDPEEGRASGQVTEDHLMFIEHLLSTTHFTIDHSEQNRKKKSLPSDAYVLMEEERQ